MNCQDAREGFSALFHGGMGLTEWALLDAHARQCLECRKEREPVQEMVNSRQQELTRVGVSTGIASLAILVAIIVFLWPREWPDNLKPRPSKGRARSLRRCEPLIRLSPKAGRLFPRRRRLRKRPGPRNRRGCRSLLALRTE